LEGDRGDLSGTRLSNKHLAEVATRKGLVACLERPSDACGKKSPATLLEAIVGAVYLDSDYNLSSVRKTMIALRSMEVLHDHPSKRKRETLGRVPTAEIRSIALEYDVFNSGETGQLALYRTVPVCCI
jgi:dsRNA-specific ribonuclease